MSTYKTRAIVLTKKTWRENDALYSFYSEDFGKIKAVAKGAKRISSKLAPHLEPLMVTDLMVARSSRGVDKVAGSSLVRDFCLLKNNFPRLILAGQAVELVDEFVDLEHGDARIFELLKRFFILLNDGFAGDNDFVKSKTALKIFILQLLDYLGYTPELYSCVNCKTEIAEAENFFHSARGGMLCKKCSQIFLERAPISNNTIKFLRLMLISDLGEIERISLTENLLKETERIIDSFLHYQLDRELASDRYLTNWKAYAKLA
ncbi:MAG: DNA repair protein RecO [Patescibacteria group bacterium]|nr:DNA repair protein RecO [Patescibacteria group bacterium]MDD5490214.1 DNA repair protein RecO [Patescibacteria group bacterium]